jgi:predicted transcriptional regulator
LNKEEIAVQNALFELESEVTSSDRVNILLSLHNKWFQKILDGTKKYEYRVAFPKSKVRAYIYVPEKIKSIKGYVDLERPITGSPEEISTIYANCGDGSYESMFNYIGKNKIAYAMKIEHVVAFEKVIPYTELKSRFPDFFAPRSYIILDKNPALLKYIVCKSAVMRDKTADPIDKLSIPYSVGGMAHYYESLTDLIEYRLTPEIKKIVINTSVQPNSIPHFGTITTFFCAFIFAKMIKAKYDCEVEVEIDYIECAPAPDYHQKGGDYCYSISKTPSSDKPDIMISDYFISNYYLPLLQWAGSTSGITYSTRLYNDFQKNTAVRTAVIKICNDLIFFKPLLNPKQKKLHIRPECPICGSVDKLLKKTEITDICPNSFNISSYCGKHGAYHVDIDNSGRNYIEINTQLRDIAKGALIDSYLDDNILGIMFDGGDWGGTWTHHIHCRSMQRLDYTIPLRLFAPLILDWSGGKLSKSIYRSDSSSIIDNPIEDYKVFTDTYGNKGLQCIYDEVSNWLSSPKKFFRNYSLKYILEVLKKIAG